MEKKEEVVAAILKGCKGQDAKAYVNVRCRDLLIALGAEPEKEVETNDDKPPQ